jgi:hypothetical protein
MTDESHYEIKFSGSDMSPDVVPAAELGGLISSLESLITAQALRDNPFLDKSDLSISVTSITKGSLALEFYLHQPIVQAPIIKAISKDIQRNDFSNYSPKETDCVKNIIHFAKKYRCKAQISEGDEQKTVLAEITDETQIIPASLITGLTTVYGKIFQVGGQDPNIHIETPTGEHLICKVTREQAKTLANKLYSWVGLSGKARWESKFFKILDFEVEKIIDFEPGSALQTLSEIGSSIRKHYEDVTDVKAYIDDLRNGDEEG